MTNRFHENVISETASQLVIDNKDFHSNPCNQKERDFAVKDTVHGGTKLDLGSNIAVENTHYFANTPKNLDKDTGVMRQHFINVDKDSDTEYDIEIDHSNVMTSERKANDFEMTNGFRTDAMIGPVSLHDIDNDECHSKSSSQKEWTGAVMNTIYENNDQGLGGKNGVDNKHCPANMSHSLGKEAIVQQNL